jgi:hypothetical protein
MKAENYQYKGQNVIFVNPYGLFGHYIFKNLINNNEENLKEITTENLPLNKQYYLFCNNLDFIIKNHDHFKNYNINYFVDSYFEEIIKFLSQYYFVKEIPITQKSVLSFLGMDNFSLEQIKKLGEELYHFKLLYIFFKLYKELNLNPSRLINLNKNVNAVFNFNDFKNLNKDNYPLSFEAIKSDNFEDFVNTLFKELR